MMMNQIMIIVELCLKQCLTIEEKSKITFLIGYTKNLAKRLTQKTMSKLKLKVKAFPVKKKKKKNKKYE